MAFLPTITGHKLFGSWLVDYIFAFAFGIAFQYFSIKPTRYGWMAITVFLIFMYKLEK